MPILQFSSFARKKAVLWLLSALCLGFVFILKRAPDQNNQALQSLAQADSLIMHELAIFKIDTDAMRVIDYPVTDGFARKHYVLHLPEDFSKTHLHFALNSSLRQYTVETAAIADVPNQRINILILYRNKIIRSLELRTVTDQGRTGPLSRTE